MFDVGVGTATPLCGLLVVYGVTASLFFDRLVVGRPPRGARWLRIRCRPLLGERATCTVV